MNAAREELKPGEGDDSTAEGARPIYLDYNASTPVAPEVMEAIRPYFASEFGHPSAAHSLGIETGTAIERARRRIAKALGGVAPEAIVFTGGGTEANNLAILGTALGPMARQSPTRRKILTFAAEHKAVLEPFRHLAESFGFAAKILPVDSRGRTDLDALKAELNESTLLVSMMFANNEVGTIQPVAEVGRFCREHGVLFHCDAVQAFGKIPVDVIASGVDLLSISGHKIYAPKGTGALYIREGVELLPLISGGGQERGLRGGTQNVPGIVGLGEATRLALSDLDAEQKRLGDLRDMLWRLLQENVQGVHRNGAPGDSLAGTLHVSFAGTNSRRLVADLSLAGLACSAGSACSTETGNDAADRASHVLLAMGLNEERLRGAVRLSLGRYTTEAEIVRATELIATTVVEQRRES